MPRPFFQKAFERWLAVNESRFDHPPKIIGRGRSVTLSFRGITPRIRGYVTRQGAGVVVMHEGECVDLLVVIDVDEIRHADGRYFCESCLEPEMFDSRQALWEDHCFEPLLEWANERLQPGKWLHLRLSPGVIYTIILPKDLSDTEMDGLTDEEFKGAWPVVVDTSSTRLQAPEES